SFKHDWLIISDSKTFHFKNIYDSFLKNLRPCIRESLDGKTWREQNGKKKGFVEDKEDFTSLGERVVSNLCFDLHLIYFGTAWPVIHAWLLNIYFIVFEGNELPKFMRWISKASCLSTFQGQCIYHPPPLPTPPKCNMGANPYLENTVVNKTNHMIEEDSILEKAIGTETEWCPIECLDQKTWYGIPQEQFYRGQMEHDYDIGFVPLYIIFSSLCMLL
ncbi:hypothetical protein HID58_051305, partial [Brassica napus]